MKYSTIAVGCIAIAGVLVIAQFSTPKADTALTSRKIVPYYEKKLEKQNTENNKNIIQVNLKKTEKPLSRNVIHPVQINKNDINDRTNDNINKNTNTNNNTDVEAFAQKLRTTYVPGVYCQQVADDGTYRNQKHYFYNQKKEQFVEIPGVYFISSTERLGDLKEEYEKYGSKSDVIKYKGKKIKIWTMR